MSAQAWAYQVSREPSTRSSRSCGRRAASSEMEKSVPARGPPRPSRARRGSAGRGGAGPSRCTPGCPESALERLDRFLEVGLFLLRRSRSALPGRARRRGPRAVLDAVEAERRRTRPRARRSVTVCSPRAIRRARRRPRSRGERAARVQRDLAPRLDLVGAADGADRVHDRAHALEPVAFGVLVGERLVDDRPAGGGEDCRPSRVRSSVRPSSGGAGIAASRSWIVSVMNGTTGCSRRSRLSRTSRRHALLGGVVRDGRA
jgi:hypothetical protein